MRQEAAARAIHQGAEVRFPMHWCLVRVLHSAVCLGCERTAAIQGALRSSPVPKMDTIHYGQLDTIHSKPTPLARRYDAPAARASVGRAKAASDKLAGSHATGAAGARHCRRQRRDNNAQTDAYHRDVLTLLHHAESSIR